MIMEGTTCSIRVRLSFDNYPELSFLKAWFLINSDRTKTIADLVEEIRHRYDVPCNVTLELTIEGCILPCWESIGILRDNDFIRVAAVEKHAYPVLFKEPHQCPKFDPCDTDKEIVKKKRKREKETSETSQFSVTDDLSKESLQVKEKQLAKCKEILGSVSLEFSSNDDKGQSYEKKKKRKIMTEMEKNEVIPVDCASKKRQPAAENQHTNCTMATESLPVAIAENSYTREQYCNQITAKNVQHRKTKKAKKVDEEFSGTSVSDVSGMFQNVDHQEILEKNDFIPVDCTSKPVAENQHTNCRMATESFSIATESLSVATAKNSYTREQSCKQITANNIDHSKTKEAKRIDEEFIGTSVSDVSGTFQNFCIDHQEILKNKTEERNEDIEMLENSTMSVERFGNPTTIEAKKKKRRRLRKNKKEKNMNFEAAKNEPSKLPAFGLTTDMVTLGNNGFCQGAQVYSKDAINKSHKLYKKDSTSNSAFNYSSNQTNPHHIFFDEEPEVFVDESGIQDDTVHLSCGLTTDISKLPNEVIHHPIVAGGKCEIISDQRLSDDVNFNLSTYHERSQHFGIQHNNNPIEAFQDLDETMQRQHGNKGIVVAPASVDKVLTLSKSEKQRFEHTQAKESKQIVFGASPFANVQVFKRKSGPRIQMPNSKNKPASSSSQQSLEIVSSSEMSLADDISKDYSNCDLLVGPPRSDDIIVYKILELADDYTPVVSSYKVAKVLRYTPGTRLVELHHQASPASAKKPAGRFDLVIEDENEILTNSMKDQLLTTISWDLLIEPRLLKE